MRHETLASALDPPTSRAGVSVEEELLLAALSRINRLVQDGRKKTAGRYLTEFDACLTLLNRVADYVDWKSEGPNPLLPARALIKMVKRGCDEQKVALFLETYYRERGRRSPGRHLSTGKLALRALELKQSDSKLWTWQRVADELCKCGKQNHDSCCKENLRQAARSLRHFIHELNSESTASPKCK